MTSIEDTIRTYFASINSEAWDDLHQIWTAEATLSAVGARPRHGPDDIVAFYRTLFRPWTDHADTPARILVSGTSATVEVVFRGVTGDGREVTFDAVDVFDFEGPDCRVARLTNWYDLVLVRRMLSPSAAPS